MTPEHGADPRRLTDPFTLDLDEQVGHLAPGADPTTAFASGVRYRDVYGAMLLHRPQDLWVAPGGSGRLVQDTIGDALKGHRFSADDVDEWRFRKWHHLLPAPFAPEEEDAQRAVAFIVEQAIAFRDAGIPNDEAFGWIILTKGADEAIHLRSLGWNPTTYTKLNDLTTRDRHGRRQWLTSGIPAWRVLRYLAAGLTLSEAHDQEDRHNAGEDTDPAIDLLIGLAPRRRPSPASRARLQR